MGNGNGQQKRFVNNHHSSNTFCVLLKKKSYRFGTTSGRADFGWIIPLKQFGYLQASTPVHNRITITSVCTKLKKSFELLIKKTV